MPVWPTFSLRLGWARARVAHPRAAPACRKKLRRSSPWSIMLVYCTICIAAQGGNLPDYSSFGLNDKIAIVTGPSQGIGRAIAVGLAQAGAHVVVAKHPAGRHEEVRQLQAEIEAMGRRTMLVGTYVSPGQDLRGVVNQTLESSGRIDMLL